MWVVNLGKEGKENPQMLNFFDDKHGCGGETGPVGDNNAQNNSGQHNSGTIGSEQTNNTSACGGETGPAGETAVEENTVK